MGLSGRAKPGRHLLWRERLAGVLEELPAITGRSIGVGQCVQPRFSVYATQVNAPSRSGTAFRCRR